MPNREVEFTFCPRRTKRKRTSNVMCYFVIVSTMDMSFFIHSFTMCNCAVSILNFNNLLLFHFIKPKCRMDSPQGAIGMGIVNDTGDLDL